MLQPCAPCKFDCKTGTEFSKSFLKKCLLSNKSYTGTFFWPHLWSSSSLSQKIPINLLNVILALMLASSPILTHRINWAGTWDNTHEFWNLWHSSKLFILFFSLFLSHTLSIGKMHGSYKNLLYNVLTGANEKK